MRRLVINSLLIMLAFLTTVPVFAADANYDSNGVTAFYGKYEYPKEDPEKEQPSKKEETDNTAVHEAAQGTTGGTTSQIASTLPSYKGQGAIIPATGDTSNLLVSLLGFVLLLFVFFKLKEVENGEKNSIS
ncbi:hypothetical protein IGI39_004394 [Enterococcus sp. AZ135]|uniref:LPXTG cell wall anchor domain-containing protein n=1 Tax=unclassified Enterococcus TaxID=2608891 RepID=UPI003F2163BE